MAATVIESQKDVFVFLYKEQFCSSIIYFCLKADAAVS